jgi:hypothetical protein
VGKTSGNVFWFGVARHAQQMGDGRRDGAQDGAVMEFAGALAFIALVVCASIFATFYMASKKAGQNDDNNN